MIIAVGVIAVSGTLTVPVVAPAAAKSSARHHLTHRQKVRIRQRLLRQVRRNPGIVRRRSFLRRAALVNFILPVTIRLRSPCQTAPTATCGPGQLDGSALNARGDPSATVNLGPSLGQRTVDLGGALAAAVEFQDTYDGGALGNVRIKLLRSTNLSKQLRTTSVPLLWNPDISDPSTRSDKGLMDAVRTDPNFGVAVGGFGTTQTQGCGDWQEQSPQAASPYNPASTHNPFKGNTRATSALATTAVLGIPAGDGEPGYNALFADTPYDFNLGTGVGIPGFPFYTLAAQSAPGALLNVAGLSGFPNPTGPPNAFLPVYPGVDRLDNLKAGARPGDNEILGPDQTPFPTGSAPGGFTQPPNVRDTVLRTNALTLGIAQPGISVDQSTGMSDGGPLPGPQGSQDLTTGYSGGQANLFGNIPGKNVGIDVTVNLETTINSIARIVDQDLFQLPLLSGDNYPAGLFNCRQIWTGAVKNYIPGVRLTGNLRIAPAITKDGKVRIAKATVASPTNDTTAVALSACVVPYSAYVENNNDPLAPGYSTDTAAAKVPTLAQVATSFPPVEGFLHIPGTSNVLPGLLEQRRYSGGGYVSSRGNAPSTIPCNAPPTDIVKRSGLSGLVSPVTGINNLADGYTTDVDGSHVSVRGDLTVHPIDVDVLLGDQSLPETGSPPPAPPTPPETYITSAPSGQHNEISTAVRFESSSPTAVFECRLDGGAWLPCVSPNVVPGLLNAAHTLDVRAKEVLGAPDPTPAQASWTVNTLYSGPLTWVGSPPNGGTVTNNPLGVPPTGTAVNADLTSPNGGPVSITSSGAGVPPSGYSFVGQALTISAPAGTVSSPISLKLTTNVLGNPLITTAADLVVFRNGAPVPDCSPNSGMATPDPCVTARSLTLGIGSITVLTSNASVWNLGAVSDSTPPTVTCTPADALWHATNVTLACVAADTGSGLANPLDAAFTLSTTVPAGSQTANAATGTHQVCDVAGNCVTAGPVTGNKIDRLGPTVTVAFPDGRTLAPLAVAHVTYTCNDGAGSGAGVCLGTVPSGGLLLTATPGVQQVTVTATDVVGNQTIRPATYIVTSGLPLSPFKLAGTVTAPAGPSPLLTGSVVTALVPNTNTVVASTTVSVLAGYQLTLATGTYDIRVTPPNGSGFTQTTVSAVSISADRALDVVMP